MASFRDSAFIGYRVFWIGGAEDAGLADFRGSQFLLDIAQPVEPKRPVA